MFNKYSFAHKRYIKKPKSTAKDLSCVIYNEQ